MLRLLPLLLLPVISTSLAFSAVARPSTTLFSTHSTTTPPILAELTQLYPTANFPSDVVAQLGELGSNGGDYPEEEMRRKYLQTYLSMPPLSLRSRSLSLLSDNFFYSSPATGPLTRAQYLNLLKTVERSYPDIRRSKVGRVSVLEGGLVAVETKQKARLEIPFNLDDNWDFEPGHEESELMRGDWELEVVQFTAGGLISGIVDGIQVDSPIDGAATSEEDVLSAEDLLKVDKLEKKLLTMYDKLETLAGQESSMGFMKQKMDISDLKLDLSQLKELGMDSVVNTGGRSGVRGYLYAAGVDASESAIRAHFTKSVEEEEKISEVGEWAGKTPNGGISTPAECQNRVKEGEFWRGQAGRGKALTQ